MGFLVRLHRRPTPHPSCTNSRQRRRIAQAEPCPRLTCSCTHLDRSNLSCWAGTNSQRTRDSIPSSRDRRGNKWPPIPGLLPAGSRRRNTSLHRPQRPTFGQAVLLCYSKCWSKVVLHKGLPLVCWPRRWNQSWTASTDATRRLASSGHVQTAPFVACRSWPQLSARASRRRRT